VAIEGNHAYVGYYDLSYRQGVLIVDVTDATALRIMGRIDCRDPEDILVKNGVAYLAAGLGDGVGVVDVSDPKSPRVLDHVWTPYYCRSLALAGDHVCAAHGPGVPVPRTIAGMDEPMFATLRPHEDSAYFVYSGMQIIDVTHPASPGIVGTTSTTSFARGMEVTDGHAYVAASDLFVIDVSNVSSPAVVGHAGTPGQAFGVAVDGSFAYVADRDNGLQVIDIADPRSPRIVGHLDTPGLATGVDVVEGYAYVADGYGGLIVVDIRDPLAPQIAGTASTPGHAEDVAVSDGYAYVATWSYGLQVIDIREPTSPAIVGEVDTPGDVRGVEVRGDLAVLAEGMSLRIIDVADPASPVAISSLHTPYITNVTLQGDHAYLVAANGVLVVNVHDPLQPKPIGSVFGTMSAVAVDGDYIYSWQSWPEYALEVHPAQCERVEPVLISSFEATAMARGVELRWSTAFETYHRGFNVYRKDGPEADYARLNATLIEPASQGGGEYRYRDEAVLPGTMYAYRLGSVGFDGREEFHPPISIATAAWAAPSLRLGPVTPNPVHDAAVVRFALPADSQCEILFYDTFGRCVRRLLAERLVAGEHSAAWDRRDDRGDRVPRGVYFAELRASASRRSMKIVVSH
jgi:hypothetical protein